MQNCQSSVSGDEENAHFHFGGKLFIGSLANSKDLLAYSTSYQILYVSKQPWGTEPPPVLKDQLRLYKTSFERSAWVVSTLHVSTLTWCFIFSCGNDLVLFEAFFLSLSNDVLPLSSLCENKKLCIWAHLLLRGRDRLIWSSRHMECTRWA